MQYDSDEYRLDLVNRMKVDLDNAAARLATYPNVASVQVGYNTMLERYNRAFYNYVNQINDPWLLPNSTYRPGVTPYLVKADLNAERAVYDAAVAKRKAEEAAIVKARQDEYDARQRQLEIDRARDAAYAAGRERELIDARLKAEEVERQQKIASDAAMVAARLEESARLAAEETASRIAGEAARAASAAQIEATKKADEAARAQRAADDAALIKERIETSAKVAYDEAVSRGYKGDSAQYAIQAEANLLIEQQKRAKEEADKKAAEAIIATVSANGAKEIAKNLTVEANNAIDKTNSTITVESSTLGKVILYGAGALLLLRLLGR